MMEIDQTMLIYIVGAIGTLVAAIVGGPAAVKKWRAASADPAAPDNAKCSVDTQAIVAAVNGVKTELVAVNKSIDELKAGQRESNEKLGGIRAAVDAGNKRSEDIYQKLEKAA